MSKFIPTTRKQGACEICGDESGKCRRPREGDIHLCMTFADARKGQIENGYKCIKRDDKGKGWATFKLDDTQDWTEEQRREWQARAEARKQAAAQAAQARAKRSLAAIERDQLYRQLLSELELHPDDRADLKRRGFSDLEIDWVGYKSIDRNYPQLQHQYPEQLPGIAPGGQQLVNLGTGYLCPIRNRDGLIVACQLRVRVLPTGQKNRYRWLSGGDEKQHTPHFFPSNGNPEGELPLAICRPEGQPPQFVALAEGTGAKPNFVALKWGTYTIGAAGGQWVSSPATLRDALETGIAETGDSCIRLYPDAGDIQNRQVATRWETLITTLQGWGYTLSIGWWNQRTKADPDIDELSPEQFAQISYLTPEDFLALLAEQHPPQQPVEGKPLTKKERKAQQQEQRRQLARQHYQNLTQLTAERYLTINTPKLNLDELGLERGCVYIIVSAKGTGKTEGLLPILPQFKNVYAWFSRIALGREECHRLGLTWREDMGSYQGFLKVGFCSNSAYKFNPRHLQDNGILMVDECDQVFDHNYSSVCNRDGERPLILNAQSNQLAATLAGNGIALFMSADITDREVDYIKAITPSGVPVRLIVNEYKPQRGTVIFDESKTPDPQIDRLLQMLEAGIPCFVIDDVKDGVRGCKSVAQYVLNQHPEWADKIVEINSETSCTERIQQFLANINEASQSILLLCCSPSVVSGISITNGRFNEGVFGFFNGVLTISQASQALARVRGAETVHCWANKRGLVYAANRSPDPQDIRRWYQSNYEGTARHLGSFIANYNPLKQEFDSPHFDLYCKNAAYRNACQSDLRELLRVRLEEEGYTLQSTKVEGAGDEIVKQGLQESWQRIELEKVRAIGAAELLSDRELSQKMNASTRPTLEEQYQIEKTRLYKKFGEQLIDSLSYPHKSGEVFTGIEAAYLRNRQNKLQHELEAFYLLCTNQAEAVAKDYAAEERQLRQSGERFAGDVRWFTEQRELRELLGIKSLKPGISYKPEDLQLIADKAREQADAVKDKLSFSTENVSDGQIVGELLRQIGLIFDEEWITPPGGGKRYKERRINQQSWEQAWQYVQYKESLRAQIEAVEVDEAVKPIVVVESNADPVSTDEHPPIAIADHPPGVSFSKASGGGDHNPVPQLPDSASSSLPKVPISTSVPLAAQSSAMPVLPCAENLSEQEIAEFVVTIEGEAEIGSEAVQRLWRNWGDRLKRVTLNAVKRQIPVLYQRLEAMLWTSPDGYLFL